MHQIAQQKIFVTGTGTGIGKTVVSAILAKALSADYWKPVQAGIAGETDSDWVKKMLSGEPLTVHPEIYKLKIAASPHIAADYEKITIDLQKIVNAQPETTRRLIIEGAGGLMVPLNKHQFISDLIKKLDAKVIIVSRNMLGSINHSLLTAMACKQMGIEVLGWIFNDDYLAYENEIVQWSGFKKLASIPFSNNPDKTFISEQAELLRKQLSKAPW